MQASQSLLFTELGILLLFSLLLGSIVTYLGLPSVLGYLIAGMFLGPNGTGIVAHPELVEYLSELGVLLLLFYMGLEISMSKFGRAGVYALFLSPIKSGIGFALGFFVAKALGLPPVAAFVFGAALAVSSTAIISQIIIDKHWERALEANIAMAMLILEDIFSVFVIAYLLGAEASISVGKILLNSFVVLFILFVVGARLSRKVLGFFERYGHPDNFPLYGFALLLIFSYGVSFIGMSSLLGAFFAGMILSESVHARKLEEELKSFRLLFVVIFFTALGLRYSISFGPLAILLTLLGLVILILQRLAIVLFGPVFGLEPKSSAKLALIMTPLGEFSLFTVSALQSIDFSNPQVLGYFGLSPDAAGTIAHVGSEMMGANFAMIVITTFLAGYVLRREEEVEAKLAKIIPPFVFDLAQYFSGFSRVFDVRKNIMENPQFAAFFEKRTQRIVEYVLAIVFISYLIGYAISEYPEHTLMISLIGYVIASFPLTGILLAFYAVMSRYSELVVVTTGLPKEYRKKLAHSIAYIFLGTFFFVVGIVALALAQGLDVLTFMVLSILLIVASVGIAMYGAIRILRMFLVPIPTIQTRSRGTSGRRKRV